ncbi:hypothetical protein E7811_15400 [Aliigemmobacter aestuarii]|uniref:Uncharacterized protein n=1 Tax=Aliigemmobacter aestuarii TaxID=1445661 RepID=A0A4S3MNF7_9RHOB|nr:hypothetical protein [Gemmobacter aestuarii]THD82427.1 hypothetical protein E7811_15400 [Gemmobacter aestuarii]
MKKTIALFASTALLLTLATAPVHAEMSKEQKAAAALAILGTAVLLHHNDHYREGYAPADGEATAQFEMGYRDGLHNHQYASDYPTEAYMNGYHAGQRERTNSRAHRTNNVAGVKVPKAAMDSCFNDAVTGVFQTSPHNVHVVKAAQEGADNFYIELAHGHKHVVCSVNSKGEIFNTEYRRL